MKASSDSSLPLGSAGAVRLPLRTLWAVALVSALSSACTGEPRACSARTCDAAGATCGETSDGCGGVLDCGACPPDPIVAGDRWQLPGLPVVKLLSIAQGEIAALVEHHVVDRRDGGIGYVIDHPRRAVVLRHGSATPEELQGAAREGELLTDIAAGPESGSVWVAAVRWNAETKEIEPRLALFADFGPRAAGMQEIASLPLPPAHFAVDTLRPDNVELGYFTLDLLRIASRGTAIGVVGRNAAGTVYAERYTHVDGRMRRDASVPLTEPSQRIPLAMSGGTYDVLGWLGNPYRVHAAMASNGTLFAGVVVDHSELCHVDELFGSTLGGPFDWDKSAQIYALILAVDEAGVAAPVEASFIGARFASGLLLSVVTSGERCLYGGLTRTSGGSEPTLFEVGAAPRALATTHASTAFQAIAVDETGRTWAGGSWGWTQNPSGLSVAGGERFVSQLPPIGAAWSEGNVLSQGQRRSEARAILLPSRGVICVGGMDNGPDTHAGDGDASRVDADGFVDCLARE